MRDLLRWFGRAFVARIGWVVAAVVLLFFGIDAHAISCPAGQVPAFKVQTAPSTVGSSNVFQGPNPGPVGRIYNSLDAGTAAFNSWATQMAVCDGTGYREWRQSATGAFPVVSVYSSADGINNYGYRRDCLQEASGGANGYTSMDLRDTCVVYTPPTCNIPVGQQSGFLSDSAVVENAQALCFQNCNHSSVVAFDVGFQTSARAWSSDGTMCEGTADGSLVSPKDVICDPNAGFCASRSNPAAIDKLDPFDDPNTPVNEAPISDAAWPDLSTAGCVTTESGGVFCLSNYSGPAVPDNGTAGNAAAGTQTIDYHSPYNGESPGSAPTSVTYYNSATVNNSTNYGSGGDPSTPGSCGAPGQPACKSVGTCGGTGQPACKVEIQCGVTGKPPCAVKIDETGVAVVGDTFAAQMENLRAEADQEDADAFANSISGLGEGGNNNPATGWLPGDLIPDLPSLSCQTFEIQFFGGESKTFPTPLLCSWIEGTFKPMLAFFLYLVTAFFVVVAAIRTMAPGGGS